jgi:hypothetical protein
VIAEVEHEAAIQTTTDDQMHKTFKKTKIIRTETAETAITVHYCYKVETRLYQKPTS